jgi:hypothetical protein
MNYCSDSYIPKNNDNRYSKVINHVQKSNTVVLRNIAIAGESVNGIFSAFAELTFLRLCMENNMYHPHLYHYSVGSSVGCIIIVTILNARFLYETQSKKTAIKYIDAILDFFSFDSLRSIFFDIGDGKTLGDFAPPDLILKNLLFDGSLCSRDAIIQFLRGTHKLLKFDNTKQYFTSKEYYNWLNTGNNLNNIFLVCYSLRQTKMIVFTGNENRFLSGINFIDYEKLTPDNLIEAILCSSAIPLLYPQNTINRDKGTDGSTVETNQIVHLQILFNITKYICTNLIYTPILNFFKITPEKNSNFLIISNKISIQNRYEDLLEFKEGYFPIITSIQSVMNANTRINFNSKTNVPLTSLSINQPFVKELSINNITRNILGQRKQKSNILLKYLPIQNIAKRIPTFLLSKKQFETELFGMKRYFESYKEFKKIYHEYNPITSNSLVSTHVYEYKPKQKIKMLDNKFKEKTDKDGNPIELTITTCIFDEFVRCMYIDNESFEASLFLRIDTGYFTKKKQMGIVTGNILYDIYTRQSLYTCDKDKLNCCCETKKMFTNIDDVIKTSYNSFLGPNQS